MVNSVGGWASAIVLWGFGAYHFGAGPYAVSLLIVCWAAPSAVLGPLGGIYVDRLGPKRALIIGYIAAALAALGLAAAGSLTDLDIAAGLYGVTRALTGPAANALPARVVASEQLLAANSLLGAAGTTGQIAGPLTASLILALLGFRAAFVFDAATYLVGAAVVAPLPLLLVKSQGRQTLGREFVEGIAAVTHHSGLRLTLFLTAAVSFTSSAFLIVEPLYARHVLHRVASQFALFEAAAGMGSILGSFALLRVSSRLRSRRILAVSAISYGLAACLFVGSTSVPLAYLGAFVWGITAAVFGAISLTALQQLAPVHVLGRVMAVSATLTSAASTAGLPLAGVVLAALGIRGGALALAGVAIGAGLTYLIRGIRVPGGSS